MALSSLLFGWSTAQDFFFVPDHARHILLASHHETIHVGFRDEAGLLAFVEGMEREGWPLPTDVPDETFKVPTWMQRAGPAPG